MSEQTATAFVAECRLIAPHYPDPALTARVLRLCDLAEQRSHSEREHDGALAALGEAQALVASLRKMLDSGDRISEQHRRQVQKVAQERDDLERERNCWRLRAIQAEACLDYAKADLEAAKHEGRL